MSEFDWIMIFLSTMSILGIPALVIMIRGAIKWTKTEMRLDALVSEVRELITDKERIHGEMIAMMREDRKATDARLRWLEVHIWSRK